MIHAPSAMLNLRSGAPVPRLWALPRERLLPNGAERGGGRDRLRVELEMEDGGFFRAYRRIERRRERGGRLHRGAEAAERAGIGGEIRVLERGRRNAPGILTLLVHADGAVHAVVDHDHDDRQLVLDGGREILAAHEKAAVASEAHYAPLGIEPLGRDRGGNTVTHRARDRSELGREAAEAIEAVNPAGIIAGAIAQDRLRLEPLAQADHDLAEVDRARNSGPPLPPGPGIRIPRAPPPAPAHV